MKLFAICPGFGLPEAVNKERILRGNLAVLRAFAPDAHVRICCYSPGYALPADLAAGVEQVHEPGIVGQFLPWCWGMDLTLQIVRGLWAVLLNDMQARHWYSGAGKADSVHRAYADEEAYLRRRGWTKQRAIEAQHRERFLYEVRFNPARRSGVPTSVQGPV